MEIDTPVWYFNKNYRFQVGDETKLSKKSSKTTDGGALEKLLWIPSKVINSVEEKKGKFSISLLPDVPENLQVEPFQYISKNGTAESDLLKLRNADAKSYDHNNLDEIFILNEPEILRCLKQRFKEEKIYTYSGGILIALNPFKDIDNMYSDKVLADYSKLKARGVPHVWDIANVSYNRLKVQFDKVENHMPALVSILISGESGSGKTETAKFLLSFLTFVGKKKVDSDVNKVDDDLMVKIIESNPILESFGNAKTLRNDNSSRFGKFIDLRFNREGVLVDSLLNVYLLEDVRVVGQQKGNLNFHIFYQMIFGMDKKLKKTISLDKKLESYSYLSKATFKNTSVIENIYSEQYK